MTDDPGPIGWNRLLSRRFRPAGSTGPAVLAADVSTRSQLHQVRLPGGETGAVHIPVTGHSVRVELKALTSNPVTLTRLGAEIIEVTTVEFDGITIAGPTAPVPIVADLDHDANRPLDEPHFEAILDRRPPIVQPANGSTRAPIPLPTTLRSGEPLTLLIAAVTGDVRLTDWKLSLEWTVDGRRNRVRFPLSVTADTGMTVSVPGGEPEPAAIDDIAPDHWVPTPRGRQRHRREPAGRIVIDNPDTAWGDPARYLAAARSGDTDAMLHELLGLTVYVPTSSDNPPRVGFSRLDDVDLMWVFTSQEQFAAVIPHEPDAPQTMTPVGFCDLLAELDATIGLALDPNTDDSVPLFPEMIASLRRRRQRIIDGDTDA